jgi:hypothetical protein
MKTITHKHKIIAQTLITILALALLINTSLLLFAHATHTNFSGTVCAASAVPVMNAVVIADGVNGSGFATTNSLGHYLINEGLKTGTYTVEAYATGYLAANVTNVHVTAGQETTGVNIYLPLSGAITGRVTDATTSNPIANVFLYAITSGGTFGWIATTDSGGYYTIATNLATGTYNITISNPAGYISKTISGISVTAGTTTSGVNLALSESGIISGRITSVFGPPLGGVSMFALYANYTAAGIATTNATGYYRITSGLTTDNYLVMASGYGQVNTTYSVPVTAGQETPNINMKLGVSPPPASGIITGRVIDIDNSNPIAGATVTATGSGSGNAHTDQNGNYVISSGLTTGTYSVTASAKGYNSTTTTGVNVVVSQTTPNIDFQLTKIPPNLSGSVSGEITGDQNPVPEFPIPALLMLTIAATTALTLFNKKTTKKIR